MESDTPINFVAAGGVLLLEIIDLKIRHCSFVNYVSLIHLGKRDV